MTAMIREMYEAENRFNKVETDLMLLKWMVGFNLAVSVAVLFKLLV